MSNDPSAPRQDYEAKFNVSDGILSLSPSLEIWYQAKGEVSLYDGDYYDLIVEDSSWVLVHNEVTLAKEEELEKNFRSYINDLIQKDCLKHVEKNERNMSWSPIDPRDGLPDKAEE